MLTLHRRTVPSLQGGVGFQSVNSDHHLKIWSNAGWVPGDGVIYLWQGDVSFALFEYLPSQAG